MSDIIETGSKNLDLFLGGEDNRGIPNKSLILVLGQPGTKFELFTQQILFQMLRSRSRAAKKVIYLSFDGRPKEIVDEMTMFGFPVDSFVSAGGKWEFMDAFTSRIAASSAVIGVGAIPDIADTDQSDYSYDPLRVFSRSFIPNLAKYDSVSTCVHTLSSLIRSDSLEGVSLAIQTMKQIVRNRDGLHFLLMVKDLHDKQTEVLASHLVDFVFDISFGQTGGGKIAVTFEVKKSWKTIVPPISVPLSIDRRGIRLETTTRL
jgi:KaiC/GvpD/RAD55 family RecA-like ATPase